MEFNSYQVRAFITAVYPNLGSNILYPAIGIAGEAGELLDKIKKAWRNSGVMKPSSILSTLTEKQISDIAKELGDILWYVAAFATEMGLELNDIAAINLEKLANRHNNNTIKGEGDNR